MQLPSIRELSPSVFFQKAYSCFHSLIERISSVYHDLIGSTGAVFESKPSFTEVERRGIQDITQQLKYEEPEKKLARCIDQIFLDVFSIKTKEMAGYNPFEVFGADFAEWIDRKELIDVAGGFFSSMLTDVLWNSATKPDNKLDENEVLLQEVFAYLRPPSKELPVEGTFQRRYNSVISTAAYYWGSDKGQQVVYDNLPEILHDVIEKGPVSPSKYNLVARFITPTIDIIKLKEVLGDKPSYDLIKLLFSKMLKKDLEEVIKRDEHNMVPRLLKMISNGVDRRIRNGDSDAQNLIKDVFPEILKEVFPLLTDRLTSFLPEFDTGALLDSSTKELIKHFKGIAFVHEQDEKRGALLNVIKEKWIAGDVRGQDQEEVSAFIEKVWGFTPEALGVWTETEESLAAVEKFFQSNGQSSYFADFLLSEKAHETQIDGVEKEFDFLSGKISQFLRAFLSDKLLSNLIIRIIKNKSFPQIAAPGINLFRKVDEKRVSSLIPIIRFSIIAYVNILCNTQADNKGKTVFNNLNELLSPENFRNVAANSILPQLKRKCVKDLVRLFMDQKPELLVRTASKKDDGEFLQYVQNAFKDFCLTYQEQDIDISSIFEEIIQEVRLNLELVETIHVLDSEDKKIEALKILKKSPPSEPNALYGEIFTFTLPHFPGINHINCLLSRAVTPFLRPFRNQSQELVCHLFDSLKATLGSKKLIQENLFSEGKREVSEDELARKIHEFTHLNFSFMHFYASKKQGILPITFGLEILFGREGNKLNALIKKWIFTPFLLDTKINRSLFLREMGGVLSKVTTQLNNSSNTGTERLENIHEPRVLNPLNSMTRSQLRGDILHV
ncbi:hypothetical protein N9Y92_00175 [Chlamydiales bacterium]|nr:hypothetical protein [Chlamydiales bacterium]